MLTIHKSLLAVTALSLISAPSLLDFELSSPHHPRLYEVSITNLTRGQILSPPVLVTHSHHLTPLWELGAPASAELAGVAEDALNQPLITALMASGHTSDIEVATGVNGPIMPGETAMTVIDATQHNNLLSMVGMLVITNDAFVGLNGVKLPRHGKTLRIMSPAYDAGSEGNNELGAFIPGPPFGNGGVRSTIDAEGYVHIHAGIHNTGDLVSATHDWNNGAVLIKIRRM